MTKKRNILTLLVLVLAILSCGVVYAQKPVLMHRAPDTTAPTFVSGSINSAGTSLTLTFDEAVEFESSPNATGLTLTPSGSAATLTYASGTGTTALVYTISRTIAIDETATIAYSSTTGDIEDGPGNDLATFSAVAVTNNSIQQLGSLRPAVFPAIPTEAVDAGFAPNNLSTSVRTDVSQTSRGAVVTIAAGTYTEPYVASTANRTIRLTGNVTYDGAGISITAANITVDLNGYTLTYNDVDVEGVATASTTSKTNGDGVSTYPTLTPSGLTMTTNSYAGYVVEFTSGAESGNAYEVVSNTTTVLTLENHNAVSDDPAQLRNWHSGGPAGSDTFRIYDAGKTYGVGVPTGTYPGSGTFEIVNGSIVQGAGYGRGVNRGYCSGMTPIQYLDGGRAFTIGGVSVTWDSPNTGGINIKGSVGGVVKYCELTDNGTFVSNRQRSAFAIETNTGSTVQYNRIHNHRQGGIYVNTGCTAEYNEIYGDSRATNSNGIGSFEEDNVTFRYNNVYKVGQHPICMAVAEQMNGAAVHHNWCEAQSTRESPEYGYNLACGLSNRWPNDGTGNRTSANNYYNNALITYASDTVYKARSLFLAALSTADEENIYDNFIGSYSDDGTECHAASLGQGPAVTATNNTLVSTYNIYWLGDLYYPPIDYARWIDNTTIRSGADASFSTFLASTSQDSEVDFISGTYGTGTSIDDIDGTFDSAVIVRFGYNLTVTVTDAGTPVSGATVTVKDKNNNTLRSGYTTNGSGVVVVDVPTYYRQGPGMSVTTLAPLTVSAVKTTKSGSGTISPTSDDSITVTIE